MLEPLAEPEYPSGPWIGYYLYQATGARHRQELTLHFGGGAMTGEGLDDVGLFVISGRYDAANRELWWTKRYRGSHDVSYRGFREGRGIWGTWEIRGFSHGGFRIWPKALGEEDAESLRASTSVTGSIRE